MCAKEKCYMGFRGLARFKSKSLLCQTFARTLGELYKPRSIKAFHAMVCHLQQIGTSNYLASSCLGFFFASRKQQHCPPSLKRRVDEQVTDGKMFVWQMQSGVKTDKSWNTGWTLSRHLALSSTALTFRLHAPFLASSPFAKPGSLEGESGLSSGLVTFTVTGSG